MSAHLPDLVASARRRFEAGDYAQARRLVNEALDNQRGADLSTRDMQALNEATSLRTAMGHDPVAAVAFAVTVIVLGALLALYAL